MDQNANEATAAERAQWLAQLAIAIEEAQRLTWRLGISEGQNAEANGLYARLESLLTEVESLRRGGWVGEHRELDPFWMQLLPWRSTEQPLPNELGDKPA